MAEEVVTEAGAVSRDTGVAEGEVKPVEAGGEVKVEGEVKAEVKVEGAPEAYADFTVPEGTKLDEAVLGGFKALAKELNLTQEGAQKLMDLQTQNANNAAETWKTTTDGWVAEAKADKEIGGLHYEAKVELGKKALAEFGTPELTAFFDSYGLGAHPEVIRFAARIGAAIGEDTITTGGASPASGKSQAQRIFSNHP